MKRRTSKGGGAQNKKRQPPPPPRLPPPTRVGSVATRTRGKKKGQAATWDQPVPILIHIISFVDQVTLRKVSTVCKQLYQICQGHVSGTTNIVIPVLKLSASSDNPDDIGRTEKLVQQLEQNCTKLQHYRKMTITDGHKFRRGENWYKTQTKMENNPFKLNGVVSLNWLGSGSTEDIRDFSLPSLTLARILPNLREVDFSTSGLSYHTLAAFFKGCVNLEKVTWHNFGQTSYISIDGQDMTSATNLKEIYMDSAQFYDDVLSYARAFENDDTPDVFLFHQCQSKVLERISIRNARNITQKMLIKFIRKAPTSLRWFRSDLTPANMAMLRLERPGIELLN